jgi:adenylate cyclase
MAQEMQNAAWLERAGGDPVNIRGTCSIGRAPANQIVLADEKVSRRHAFIHCQDEDEFWLVDLGSSNGTYLNGRRVTQSLQLRDQDRIQIGPFGLVFRQPHAAHDVAVEPTDIDKTIRDIKSVHCWLLVTDIACSTQLNRRLSPEELPVVTGRWFSNCKRVIDDCGGAIDKYLGDGFLAYWHHGERTAGDVARALAGLKKIQESEQPPFRIVAHLGRVFTGGVTASGVERLFGAEVNFIFRMERLASGLALQCLLSEPAYERVKAHLPGREAGRHALQGFEGEHPFFSF